MTPERVTSNLSETCQAPIKYRGGMLVCGQNRPCLDHPKREDYEALIAENERLRSELCGQISSGCGARCTSTTAPKETLAMTLERADRYFVMLRHPSGRPFPVYEPERDDLHDVLVRLFLCESDANAAMTVDHAAQAWGYEVYPWSME